MHQDVIVFSKDTLGLDAVSCLVGFRIWWTRRAHNGAALVLAISGKLRQIRISENVINDIMPVPITHIMHILQIRHFMHRRERTYWSKIV